MTDRHLIELIDVSKEYAGDVALEHVNLYIKDGEFLTLLGPSGCGKTTMLRLIAGFIQPTSGRIEMDGVDIANVPPYKRKINTVFQKYALFPHLNVFDNIAFGLKIKKMDKALIKEKVEAMLELVNLRGYGERWIDQLSGGQQQRVGIARAFVSSPKVIFADEPTGNLDSRTSKQVLYRMLEMSKNSGVTFVMVTHEPELAECADRIVTILDGKVCSNVVQDEETKKKNRDALFADLEGNLDIGGEAAKETTGSLANKK